LTRSESNHRAKWRWRISELSLLGIKAAHRPPNPNRDN
jgi:hypothetical protein